MAGKEFSLCRTCSERQSDATIFGLVSPRECFICRGLILRVPAAGRLVLRQARRYAFRTFSVGMIIPAEVQEREDQLRSDLQIRGMETIKSQTAKEITDFVRKKTGRRIDRRNPELMILVDLDKDEVTATAKSLYLYAKYTKPRGVSQRRELCENCSGRGCAECKDGYVDIPSMEEVLGRRLAKIFRSAKAKFTWIGSEDADSVVYAPGRPFVVEVKDPKRRVVGPRFAVVTGRGSAKVTNAKVLKGKPTSIPSFIFKTKAFIEPLEQMSKDSIPEAKKIEPLTVKYRNNKGKTVYKKVYSTRLERKGKGFVAEIKLDGGLPVKRLVSGESTSPSLSELIGVPLVCRKFDILRVWESGPVRSGSVRRGPR